MLQDFRASAKKASYTSLKKARLDIIRGCLKGTLLYRLQFPSFHQSTEVMHILCPSQARDPRRCEKLENV